MSMQDIYSPPPLIEIQSPCNTGLLQSDEVVMDCLSMLAASVHLDTAIDSFLETLGCFYGAESSFLFQLSAESDAVSCAFNWPVSSGNLFHVHSVQDFSEWVTAFESEGFLRLCATDDSRLMPLFPFCVSRPTSAFAVPLYTDTVLSGFLCVVNPTAHLSDMKVLLAVASLSVVELHKQQLMAQLDHLHRKDPLTGTYNRASYVSSLSNICQSAPATMGAVLTSVNGLKSVNTALGLTFGDSILQQTAEIMEKTLCTSIYRISGNEFASLHPDCSAADFQALVDALRTAFDASGVCNVSVGSAWTDCEMNIHDLLSQAGQQLTAYKKAADSAVF